MTAEFSFNFLGAVIAGSWLLSVPRPLYASVILSFLVFSSPSTTTRLLMLLLIQVFGFIQAGLGTRRENAGLIQKRFVLVFSGLMTALFGVLLGGKGQGAALIFGGLLLMIPNGVTTWLFGRFYERLTTRAFVGSVLIPSWVGLGVLFDLRGSIRAEIGVAWEVVLWTLVGITLFFSILGTWVRTKFGTFLVHWANAWMGLGLLVLMAESEPAAAVTLTTLSVLVVNSVLLLKKAVQMSPQFMIFSKMAVVGIPSFLGFTSVSLMSRLALSMGTPVLALMVLALFLLGVALVRAQPNRMASRFQRLDLGFGLLVLVQIIAGCGLFWMAERAFK